jgi:hypothetical protein
VPASAPIFPVFNFSPKASGAAWAPRRESMPGNSGHRVHISC